ncbi:MAG: hypothetical protein KDC10_13415, partial [Calditrichaeota bacterium]|nr:hypothetical protein [Calditrichota bacterium]
EAVKVFCPTVFARLSLMQELLTSTAKVQSTETPDQESSKKALEGLIKLGSDQHQAIEHLIHDVFPGAARLLHNPVMSSDYPGGWRKARRVAHIDYLRTYLEYVENDQIRSIKQARTMLGLMHNREGLDSFLRSMPRDKVHGVLTDLMEYEADFSHIHVVPTLSVLFNLLPELPINEELFIPIGPYLTIRTIAKSMFEKLKNPDTIYQVADEVMSSIRTFFSRRRLLSIVGPDSRTGDLLISRDVYERALAAWCKSVRAARPEQLVLEPGLLDTLIEVREHAHANGIEFIAPEGPDLTESILRSAQGTMFVRGIAESGSRTMRTLSWDRLLNWFGDASRIQYEVAKLKHAGRPDTEELVALAEKYSMGWRPDQETEE